PPPQGESLGPTPVTGCTGDGALHSALSSASSAASLNKATRIKVAFQRHVGCDRILVAASHAVMVDDQLEFGRLHHRQVRWFGALEDATRIGASLAMRIRQARAIGYQPAHFGVLARSI